METATYVQWKGVSARRQGIGLGAAYTPFVAIVDVKKWWEYVGF